MAEIKFTKLVPNIFYRNINDALAFLVDCLGFSVTHNELNTSKPFCVIEKDGLRINVFENEQLAAEHSPEFRLVTEDIESVYQTIATTYPQYLHPNLSKVMLRPWGAKEFALMDKQLGVVIQEW